MARLDITEYEFWNEVYRLPKEPGRDQVLAITIKSNKSKPFGVGTKLIRIASDIICHYVICSAFIPEDKMVATQQNKRLWPRQAVDLVVNPGDCVAVIAGS